MSRSPAGPDRDVKAELRAELDSMRVEFHQLVDSLSTEDLRRPTANPGWSNGEALFHITFALMLLRSLGPMVRLWGRLPDRYSRGFAGALDFGTPQFNWFNELGARAGARIDKGERIGRRYDDAH